MTEEEKESIELLENDKNYITDSFYESFRITIADRYTKSLKIVLNLIEKQQTELKKKNKIIDDITEDYSKYQTLTSYPNKITETAFEIKDRILKKYK